MTLENSVAVFAAGCFWGVEEHFRKIPGVLKTRVGYTGGHLQNPTYKLVCQGDSGHAEALEIIFDPTQISYRELVDEFFANHDPTTVDRQGPDYGHQYRSAIFFHSEAQRTEAESTIARLNREGRFSAPIVTSVEPAAYFWEAEDYHQCYIAKQRIGS